VNLSDYIEPNGRSQYRRDRQGGGGLWLILWSQNGFFVGIYGVIVPPDVEQTVTVGREAIVIVLKSMGRELALSNLVYTGN
jgi:hypothetical protein